MNIFIFFNLFFFFLLNETVTYLKPICLADSRNDPGAALSSGNAPWSWETIDPTCPYRFHAI